MKIKVIEKVSDLPENMTYEQLDRILYPNLLALCRIIAQSIKEKKDKEKDK